MLIIINDNNHPDTNLPVIRQQRRTVNPPIPTLITAELRNPLDARRNTATGHHGTENVIALHTRLSNTVHEGGLKHSGDLKRRRCEKDAKGGVWADEKELVLLAYAFQNADERIETHVSINACQRQAGARLGDKCMSV